MNTDKVHIKNTNTVNERDRTLAEIISVLRFEPFLKKIKKPDRDNPYYSYNGKNISFLNNIQYITSTLFENNRSIPIIKHFANLELG